MLCNHNCNDASLSFLNSMTLKFLLSSLLQLQYCFSLTIKLQDRSRAKLEAKAKELCIASSSQQNELSRDAKEKYNQKHPSQVSMFQARRIRIETTNMSVPRADKDRVAIRRQSLTLSLLEMSWAQINKTPIGSTMPI